MELTFTGDIEELIPGIEILGSQLGFKLSNRGVNIYVLKDYNQIEVVYENGQGLIKYNKKIHFFRALGLFIENLKKNEDFRITETIYFQTNGAMFDVSRNAVMTVACMKNVIEKIALMGLNFIMMYTEDTYSIPERKYFGYMRGKYSEDELRKMDEYAYIFGIEMVPCIQTLAHLTEALKWNYAKDMRDNKDILLVDYDKTYQFIEEMIISASKPFRSNRIHIGMDEAHNLGLGRYLEINGYQRRFDIMNKHLQKVVDIVAKHDLEPMIWSDMYFRIGSKSGGYYDLESNIPEEIKRRVPENVQLVYWDYYHEEETTYAEFLKRHKSFGKKPIFAGAVWTSAGMIVNYKKTFDTTNAALSACKKEEINEVIATMWGNDGAETNMLSALLGLQLFAEHGYSEDLCMDRLKERFEFCTGGNFDDFMALSDFDNIKANSENGEDLQNDPNGEKLLPSNPSKYLLWQDILVGLFDKNIEGMNLNTYYLELGNRMKLASNRNEEWKMIFQMPEKMCKVLSIKCELGVEIKKLYDNNDSEGLRQIIDHKLPELQKSVIELWETHREQWLFSYKPFGWEIMDIRYGGLITRINTISKRLNEYISGTIDEILELEEERLLFDGYINGKDRGFGRCNVYTDIVSANPFTWV